MGALALIDLSRDGGLDSEKRRVVILGAWESGAKATSSVDALQGA
jgi:hypothetical protein